MNSADKMMNMAGTIAQGVANPMASLQFGEVAYITSASVVAVLQRSLGQKKYVYQIDVEWSDGNTTSCFRRYSDFFDFQCGLLNTFPKEAGLERDSQRIIPFLPGKQLFNRSTYQLAQERMPQINDYVQKLVALPANVSQSERVLQFFRSNWQEDRLRTVSGTGSLPTAGSQYRVVPEMEDSLAVLYSTHGAPIE